MTASDTIVSDIVHDLVYQLAAEHAEFIALMCGCDTVEAEALLQVGLGLSFASFEVAAATDYEVCAYLASVLQFVFTNREAAFYRPPEREQPMTTDNDWAPPTGESVSPPKARQRQVFKPKWQPAPPPWWDSAPDDVNYSDVVHEETAPAEPIQMTVIRAEEDR